MIAMLAIDTGIPPDTLWRADPRDLSTIVDVLTERNRRQRRGR